VVVVSIVASADLLVLGACGSMVYGAHGLPIMLVNALTTKKVLDKPFSLA